MSFFRFCDPRELFERISIILGHADEGASASTQGLGNHGVEMSWIPKEHRQIAQRQRSHGQHHGVSGVSR